MNKIERAFFRGAFWILNKIFFNREASTQLGRRVWGRVWNIALDRGYWD